MGKKKELLLSISLYYPDQVKYFRLSRLMTDLIVKESCVSQQQTLSTQSKSELLSAFVSISFPAAAGIIPRRTG